MLPCGVSGFLHQVKDRLRSFVGRWLSKLRYIDAAKRQG